ncbi:tRNA (adenosine(37)-N6)-threonylcarbamoyltransferase complex ATPase subunit type 1 TsaE [bacterium]|nr:tRNA (adenosine(37)-N6)-threonylcarbamoyltransferase complex ATPase subunit type 1 TsaE [bacterium]
MDKSNQKLIVQSISETHALAAKLATKLSGGEVIGLSGELGAGKTEFVRGILQTLNPGAHVSSPSYVIEHIYESNQTLLYQIHHLDLYRLTSGSDYEELGSYLHDRTKVTFVEWPERLNHYQKYFDLIIEFELSDDKRLLSFKPLSPAGEKLCF